MKSRKRMSKLLIASLLSYGLSNCGLNNINVVRAAERNVGGINIDDANLFKTKKLKLKLECGVCLEKLESIFSKNENPADPNRVVDGKLTPDTILLAAGEVICETCRGVSHKRCWDRHHDLGGGVVDHQDRCPLCREEKNFDELTEGKTNPATLAQFWDYMQLRQQDPEFYRLPWPKAPHAALKPPKVPHAGLDVELDIGGAKREDALEKAKEKAEKKAEREKAEREKAEREKAEREKAEREKAEREEAEREKAKRETSMQPIMNPTSNINQFGTSAIALTSLSAFAAMPTATLSTTPATTISPTATPSVTVGSTPPSSVTVQQTQTHTETTMTNQHGTTPSGTRVNNSPARDILQNS